MPKPKPKPRPKPYYITLVLTVLLAGCVSTAPLQTPVVVENESTEAKALRLAHVAVNEASAALTALNNVIGSNAESGVWTKAQAQSYLDTSKEYGKQVYRARVLLSMGNPLEARTQAELVKSMIMILHKKVAEAARKEGG